MCRHSNKYFNVAAKRVDISGYLFYVKKNNYFCVIEKHSNPF